MHNAMMAESPQGALRKEREYKRAWRVARPLAAATASEQDKCSFRVDCGNLFGRFGASDQCAAAVHRG